MRKRERGESERGRKGWGKGGREGGREGGRGLPLDDGGSSRGDRLGKSIESSVRVLSALNLRNTFLIRSLSSVIGLFLEGSFGKLVLNLRNASSLLCVIGLLHRALLACIPDCMRGKLCFFCVGDSTCGGRGLCAVWQAVGLFCIA